MAAKKKTAKTPRTPRTRGTVKRVAAATEHPLVSEARRMVEEIKFKLDSATFTPNMVVNRGAYIAHVFEAATGKKPSEAYVAEFAPLVTTRTLRIDSPYSVILEWLRHAAAHKWGAAQLIAQLRPQGGLVNGEPDEHRVALAIDAIANGSRRMWIVIRGAMATIHGKEPPAARSLSRLSRKWRDDIAAANRR